MPWVPIVDGHADTLSQLVREARRLGEESARGQSDLARLRKAGVALQILAICVESSPAHESWLRQALEQIDRFHLDLAGHEEARLISGRADLDWLGPGRVGFLLGLEGAGALGTHPGLLRILFRLGVRVLGLTWNTRNQFADGVGVAGGAGLTGAGRELLALAEQLGMVVDVAHLGEAGFRDVISLANKPVVASHANARALCQHPRNLDDDQLRALAARGGVVGVNLYPPFLASAGIAGTEDVLRHLDHLLRVAGVPAVGLGLDFDGIEVTPADLPDITALPRLLAAIGRLGLTEADRAAILGGNWLRVLRQVLP